MRTVKAYKYKIKEKRRVLTMLAKPQEYENSGGEEGGEGRNAGSWYLRPCWRRVADGGANMQDRS